MNRFYSALVGDWLDKPSVCLAFGVRWPLDAYYTQAIRRTKVIENICGLHKVDQITAIDPQKFLKTLHKKRITQSLPDELDRFKRLELVQQGPHGNDYCSLYTNGWFNAPKVAAAFQVKHEQDPKEREHKIKGALYWDLGVVSLSQVHPRQFCELIVDKGIGFTLPAALVQASRGAMRRSPIKRSSKAMRRTAMKRKTPKSNPRRSNQAFLDACRGEPCHLRVKGVCLGASGKKTVVPSHSNQLRHGKGMGIKAHDMYTVPGCFACHSWVDQGSAPKETKFLVWDRAFTRWEPRRARKLRAKENPVTATTALG